MNLSIRGKVASFIAIIVLSLSVIVLCSCNSIPQEVLDLQEQIQSSDLSSRTNEELASFLDQIRAEEEKYPAISSTLSIIEDSVQSEFEKRYQDTYNSKLLTEENTEEFQRWKDEWVQQLKAEQEKNHLFSDYFYENFIEKI